MNFVDVRYKESLIKTMLHRAKSLSSTGEYFQQEYSKLRSIYIYIHSSWSSTQPHQQASITTGKIVRINIPFKYTRNPPVLSENN